MELSRTIETENGEMIVKRVSVPLGLEELMEGLAKEVILKKPKDLYVFAWEYFTRLLELRQPSNFQGGNSKNVNRFKGSVVGTKIFTNSRIIERKSTAVSPHCLRSKETIVTEKRREHVRKHLRKKLSEMNEQDVTKTTRTTRNSESLNSQENQITSESTHVSSGKSSNFNDANKEKQQKAESTEEVSTNTINDVGKENSMISSTKTSRNAHELNGKVESQENVATTENHEDTDVIDGGEEISGKEKIINSPNDVLEKDKIEVVDEVDSNESKLVENNDIISEYHRSDTVDVSQLITLITSTENHPEEYQKSQTFEDNGEDKLSDAERRALEKINLVKTTEKTKPNRSSSVESSRVKRETIKKSRAKSQTIHEENPKKKLRKTQSHDGESPRETKKRTPSKSPLKTISPRKMSTENVRGSEKGNIKASKTEAGIDEIPIEKSNNERQEPLLRIENLSGNQTEINDNNAETSITENITEIVERKGGILKSLSSSDIAFIIKIQSVFRGYKTRKNIESTKKIEVMQNNSKGIDQKAEILNAATKIQALVRGFIARANFRKLLKNHEKTSNSKEKNSENSSSVQDEEILKQLEELDKLPIPNTVDEESQRKINISDRITEDSSSSKLGEYNMDNKSKIHVQVQNQTFENVDRSVSESKDKTDLISSGVNGERGKSIEVQVIEDKMPVGENGMYTEPKETAGNVDKSPDEVSQDVQQNENKSSVEMMNIENSSDSVEKEIPVEGLKSVKGVTEIPQENAEKLQATSRNCVKGDIETDSEIQSAPQKQSNETLHVQDKVDSSSGTVQIQKNQISSSPNSKNEDESQENASSSVEITEELEPEIKSTLDQQAQIESSSIPEEKLEMVSGPQVNSDLTSERDIETSRGSVLGTEENIEPKSGSEFMEKVDDFQHQRMVNEDVPDPQENVFSTPESQRMKENREDSTEASPEKIGDTRISLEGTKDESSSEMNKLVEFSSGSSESNDKLQTESHENGDSYVEKSSESHKESTEDRVPEDNSEELEKMIHMPSKSLETDEKSPVKTQEKAESNELADSSKRTIETSSEPQNEDNEIEASSELEKTKESSSKSSEIGESLMESQGKLETASKLSSTNEVETRLNNIHASSESREIESSSSRSMESQELSSIVQRESVDETQIDPKPTSSGPENENMSAKDEENVVAKKRVEKSKSLPQFEHEVSTKTISKSLDENPNTSTDLNSEKNDSSEQIQIHHFNSSIQTDVRGTDDVEDHSTPEADPRVLTKKIGYKVESDDVDVGAKTSSSSSFSFENPKVQNRKSTHELLNYNISESRNVKSEGEMESKKCNNSTLRNKNAEDEAAIKIQAGFRGYKVRKQLKMKTKNNNNNNNSPKKSARRKSSGSENQAKKQKENIENLEEKSAVKIQAGVRGFLVRRKVNKNATKFTSDQES